MAINGPQGARRLRWSHARRATRRHRDHGPPEGRRPFQGLVTVLVEAGARVESGEVLAVLEAMKMEAPITAPRAGTVVAVAFEGTRAVSGGDALVDLA
ncbi:biotin/lipoyl-containing protein [Nocardioides daphniae]|uniref:biotin/lipoyl-containing protein n=1 Tax=Nocardioides daphniae TaxID=402297 RepID=UPI0023B0653A|nr:biotin/lipoyl-containing protein [Nocardioides daphniae]